MQILLFFFSDFAIYFLYLTDVIIDLFLVSATILEKLNIFRLLDLPLAIGYVWSFGSLSM